MKVYVRNAPCSYPTATAYCKGDIVLINLGVKKLYIGLVSHTEDGVVSVRIWNGMRLSSVALYYLPAWLTVIGSVPEGEVW